MIVVSHRPQALLRAQLERSRRDEVTYSEVGETRSTTLPPGYRHDRWLLPVGVGEAAWRRAKEAIDLWKAHAHAGITITPPGAPIQQGTTVIASKTIGPVTIIAPCRVIYVTEEPNTYGFAYGTLPGHPERGEEAFHVLLGDDGTVTTQITAFSRPDDLPTRLAGPIARQIQQAATRRYLTGIGRHTAGTK